MFTIIPHPLDMRGEGCDVRRGGGEEEGCDVRGEEGCDVKGEEEGEGSW